jgi:hypothetical protein
MHAKLAHQIRRESVDYLMRLGLDGANLNQDEPAEDLPPEVEAALLAVWRRVVREGSGPELTLPEAAVLLGTSVESVRRRIKAGRLTAFHDKRGRVRIRVSLSTSPEADGAEATVAELWAELKATKQNLATASSQVQGMRREVELAHTNRREAQQELEALLEETQELRDELTEARDSLDHSQRELTSLWRVMSSRKGRSASSLTEMTEGNEAFDLPPSRGRLDSERSRIQDQISRVRGLSRRRRWPWPQAS